MSDPTSPGTSGQSIEIESADGFVLGAYENKAIDASSSVVILQEIFGVNAHIRSVVDRYAALGYHAVAPALFDRVEPGLELAYNAEEAGRGIAARKQLGWESMSGDVAAAVAYVAQTGPVGVVGYCLGGTLAWLAASTSQATAAVSYYGGGIHELIDRSPTMPMMLHFAADDQMIPLETVDQIRSAHDDIPVHIYEGVDHGFNTDDRFGYDADASALALERTLGFLRSHGVGTD